jgi:hypothetical protein
MQKLKSAYQHLIFFSSLALLGRYRACIMAGSVKVVGLRMFKLTEIDEIDETEQVAHLSLSLI